MHDLGRVERADPKIVRAQRSTERPTGRLVQVRLALLNELEGLQKRLDAYLTGYISSRELTDLCTKVGSRLELGKQERYRLWDVVFWEDVRDDLNRAYERTIGLPPLIKEDFEESVEDFEKKLQEVIAVVSGAVRSPEGGDRISLASEVLISIGDMRLAVEPIAVRSRQMADSVLKKIGHVIERIREWIEVADEKDREPGEQFVGYEDKRERMVIDGERLLQSPTKVEVPTPEAKTIRR